MRLAISIIAVGLASALTAAPANAQTRVFVSAAGSDGNACSFAAPCRSFQHAHDTVMANGEIVALDPTGYGTLTINKAVSINGQGFAEILVGTGNGITINVNSSSAVKLSGLIVDGQSVGGAGIAFLGGKSLVITNCVVRNFVGSGIGIAPSTSSKIIVSNTLVTDNGGHGIYAQPSGTPVVTTFFNRVESYNNGGVGIGLYSNYLSGGSLDGSAIDTVAVNNDSAGFYVYAGAIATKLSIFRSTAGHNGPNSDRGVRAENGGVIWIAQSNLLFDQWSTDAYGAVYSFQDNMAFNPAPSNIQYSLH